MPLSYLFVLEVFVHFLLERGKGSAISRRLRNFEDGFEQPFVLLVQIVILPNNQNARSVIYSYTLSYAIFVAAGSLNNYQMVIYIMLASLHTIDATGRLNRKPYVCSG